MKTLREVYTELGVGRTTVQYWLDKILCRPKQSEKDNTPLEFSDEEVKLLWCIRFYKELGYSNEEVKRIINDSDFDCETEMRRRVDKLKKEKEHLEKIINVAETVSNTGVTPVIAGYGTFDYNETLEFFQKYIGKSYDVGSFSYEDAECIGGLIDDVFELFGQGKAFDCDNVQRLIAKIRRIYIEYIPVFVYCFKMFFLGTNLYINALEEDYCKDFAVYFSDAISFWCEHSDIEKIDRQLFDIISRFEDLYDGGVAVDSEEALALAKVTFNCVCLANAEKYHSDIKAYKTLVDFFKLSEMYCCEENKLGEHFIEYVTSVLDLYYDKELKESVENEA